MRGSFTNDPFDWQEKPQSPDARMTPPMLATVTDVFPRFRANVLTAFGEPFQKVRYFGPALKQGGNAHGRAFGLKKNQLVLLEFIGGSFRAPIITQVFPFSTKDSDLSNIQDFWNKYSFIDPETDIIDFHESGYAVRQTTNKIEVYNDSQEVVLEFDFTSKKATLTFENVEINSKVQINGDTKIVGKTTFEGDLDITGKIEATEKIVSDADVIAAGTSLKEHNHLYNPGPLPPTKTSPPI
ncbi:hypothetical protein [Leptospira weilii]|uniref:Baseplate assembly protein n=1 Tax=Leptospira weilii str. UI 13098 TaxID=1088542 RepID=M6QKM6_9LEPT|nr:hypothetical protein [Leptospira weilii]EMN89442.1 hypothetical protein LEP1GSC108_0373 [Leptospira weilii str. UI 13098]